MFGGEHVALFAYNNSRALKEWKFRLFGIAAFDVNNQPVVRLSNRGAPKKRRNDSGSETRQVFHFDIHS